MLSLFGGGGLYYDYQTTIALNIIFMVGLVQLALFIALVILLVVRSKLRQKVTTNPEPPSTITQHPIDDQAIDTKQKKNKRLKKALLVASEACFYSILILSTISIAILHMIQKLGKTVLVKTFQAIGVALVGIGLHILWKYYTSGSKQAFKKSIGTLKGKKLILYCLALVLWLVFVALLFYLLNGVCFCNNNNYFGGTQFTTSFYRKIYLKGKVCPGKTICQIYATLPQTTNTSVFINIHTGSDTVNLTSTMNLGTLFLNASSSYMFTPQLDEQYAERKVWTLLYTNLNSSTLYDLTVSTGQHTISTTYKTLPAFNDTTSTVKILIGGDVAVNQQGMELFELMTNQSADLIVLGGDTTYDNGMTYCYYSWDIFYQMVGRVSRLNTISSRLIPVVLGLGNHDVGHDPMVINKAKPSRSGPWWFAYNPQHFDSDGQSIPPVDKRKGHGYHIVGSTVIFNLDSSYLQTYESQSEYLKNLSSYFTNLNYSLMANYHVPLYPSCIHQTQAVLDQSRQFYEPVFINYKFRVCFENHVHRFKRTVPISGVVYIGDGALGVGPRSCAAADRISDQYIIPNSYQESDHYWLGVLSTDKIDLVAKSRINATIIDTTTINFV